VESKEVLFPLDSRTNDVVSSAYPYSPPGKFVLGGKDKHIYVSDVKTQPQEVTKQSDEKRHNNYNGFRNDVQKSRESQIHNSYRVFPEGTLLHLPPPNHDTNKSKLYSEQLSEKTRQTHSVLNHEMYEYPQFLLRHPLQSVEHSSYIPRENQKLQEQEHQKAENQLTEKIDIKTQHIPLQEENAYSDDKLMSKQTRIAMQRTGTKAFLVGLPVRTNENTSEKESNDLATNIQHSLRNQQPTYPHSQYKSDQELKLNQATLKNQPIDSETFSEKFSNGPNKTENETCQNDLANNFLNFLKNQELKTHPYNQNKTQLEHNKYYNPFIHQLIGIESVLTNQTENETQTKESANNVKILLKNGQSDGPCETHTAQPKDIPNQHHFIQQPVDSKVLNANVQTGTNTIDNETQTDEFSRNIQNSLHNHQSIFPYKQKVAQTGYISRQTPFVHKSIGVDVFSTNLPTKQNTTDNETQTNELATNIQNSLNNRQSIYSYEQERAQPEYIYTQTPFVHQLTGVGMFTTILPIGQNRTENETQASYLATNIQNSLNSQQPIYPYKKEEHAEYVRIQKESIHQPIKFDVSSISLPTEQNTTRNETQPKFLYTRFPTSLNSQYPVYPHKQEVQMGNIHTQTPFIKGPTGVDVFSTQLPTEQNTTESETQAESLATSFKKSLSIQKSIYPYTQEIKMGNVHILTPLHSPANRR
jgi:hypothetical protein